MSIYTEAQTYQAGNYPFRYISRKNKGRGGFSKHPQCIGKPGAFASMASYVLAV